MDLIKSMNEFMSISEVAISLGVNERTIRKHVEKLFPDKMKNGVQTLLNEQEVTKVKFSLEENKQLAHVDQLPKTALEKKLLIHQAMGFLNEEIDELKQKLEYQSLKLEAAQPKIDFVDHIEVSDDSISISEFAKLLYKNRVEIGQKRLFKYLYDQNYLMNRSEPYQKWMDMGLFEIKKINFIKGKDEKATDHKVMVTGKGQTYLTKKICNSFQIKEPLNSQTQF